MLRLFVLITPNWIKDFAGAWVFYTVLPKLPQIKPRFNRIARFAPLIGLNISLIQSFVWLILYKSGWPKETLPFFIIATGIWITGGLHLDGFIDTADGIAAGKEKQLEAMKDSRIGALGLLALLSIICIQIAALLKLGTYSPIAIVISSFCGRLSPIWAISFSKYLHNEYNLNSHQKYWKGYLRESLPSIIILIISIFILLLAPLNIYTKLILIILIIIGILISIIIPHFLGKILNGHNGDSYGASVVLVETSMLFLLAILLKVR